MSGNGANGHGAEPFERIQAPDVHQIPFDVEATMRALEEELARVAKDAANAGESHKERALVVGIVPEDEHFEEMLELVRSAGVAVAGTVRQKRSQVHPRTVVGTGKLQEIVLEALRGRATVAIFDIDLKPAQARAFEDATGLKAIDRTQLILDVFAQRARSRDGKLQVELAQLKYSLPRLTEKDAGLSRLTGGIGGRGPGETVVEIGRRRIRDRIRALGEAGREPVAPARPPAAAPARGRCPRPLHHRLHQRRQEHALERPDRQRGRVRGQALHDPRPHQPAPALPPRATS